MIHQLTTESIALLDQLIATPSVSRDEAATADIVETFLKARIKGTVERIHNNVYVRTPHWDDAHPTLLMNSHHDTVKPSASYTHNPYEHTHEEVPC
jgi:acetylornithine deacetylase